MIDTLLRWIDRLGMAAAAVAALSLAAMTAIMLAEVFARSFLAQSLVFSWEYSGYLMALAFFFGAAYTLRTDGHVRVSLLMEATPPRVTAALDLFCTVIGVVVCGYVAYALGLLAWTSWSRGVASFTPMQTPLAVPQGLVAFAALLLELQMVARLVRRLTGRPPDRRLEEHSLDVEGGA